MYIPLTYWVLILIILEYIYMGSIEVDHHNANAS